MSVFTLILLFIIVYFGLKAVGNIWRDAFKGVGTERNAKHTDANKQHHTSPTNIHSEKPIAKGEGEYVDFTEER